MNYNKMIEAIASLSHERFRDIYRKVNKGTRIKKTKDQKWIKQHKTNQADLAKLNYFELPEDWRMERWLGAKEALDILLERVRIGKSLDGKFVEYASKIIHKEWLERNIDRAKDEHKVSYEELSNEAKEKDRIFIRVAIELYSSKENQSKN